MTLLLVAFRNLFQARRRSALLGLAIGMVTSLLVLLMALSAGISDSLVEAATTISSGHVSVAGFFKPTQGNAAPVVTDKSEVRALVEQNVEGLDYIVERDRGWGKIVSEMGSVQAGLNGIVAEDEQRFFDTLQLAPESEYVEGGGEMTPGDPRRLSEPGTMVVFASQAKRLQVRVGDQVTIKTETSGGMTNTADATIVAVAKDLGMMSGFAVYVPRSLVLDLYQLNADTTGALWVYLDDIDRSNQVMSELRQVFASAGYAVRDHDPNPFFFKFDAVAGEDWTGQQIDLTTWKDEVSYVAWILTAFDTLSVFVVSLLVVIIAVGIMNAMWTAVRERTREIGTMRAIGMTRFQVLRLFLLEALLLGLLASGAGALTGALVAGGVDALAIKVPSDAVKAILLSDTLHLVVTPATLVGSVLFLTAFTAASALWPSLRAALLRPVDALRHAE